MEDSWSPEEVSLETLKKLIDEGKHQFSNSSYSYDGTEKTEFEKVMEREFSLLRLEEDVEPDEGVIVVETSPRKRNRQAFEYRIKGDGIVGRRNRKSFRMWNESEFD